MMIKFHWNDHVASANIPWYFYQGMFAEATRGAANRNKIHFGSFFSEKEKLKQLQTYMKGQYDIFTQSIFQLF